MIQTDLNATVRTDTGKKSIVRKLRIDGFVPAVCYGNLKEPVLIYVSAKELKEVLSTKAKEHVLINLKTRKKTELSSKKVILKELVKHPLKRNYIHADFLVLDMDKPIKVPVAIRLLGKSEGVKMGGILDQIRRDVEVKCLAANIPEYIEIDISNLMIGESLHVKSIEVPEDIEIVTNSALTVAVILAPIVEKLEAEEVDEEVEAAEGVEEAEKEEESSKE